MIRLLRLLCLAALFLAFSAKPAAAHDLRFAEVAVHFAEDQSFTATIRYDLDAVLIGKDPGHLEATDWAAVSALRPTDVNPKLELIVTGMKRDLLLEFDGQPAPFTVEFPDYPNGEITGVDMMRLSYNPKKPQRTVLVKGTIPEGAKEFVFRGTNIGNAALSITKEGVDGAFVTALSADSRSEVYTLAAPQLKMTLGQTVIKYGLLGFEHIVPSGLDHILFVLGLFFLSQKWRTLFWQITAFTLAHSLTLTLAYFHWHAMPGDYIDIIVQLSIVYVAVENLFTRDLKWWRPIIVFAFGLLHGLAFAGNLQDIGLPDGQILTALLAFNIGVEVGHLAVVAFAFVVVGWFQKAEWYRHRIVYPASGLIAATALFLVISTIIEVVGS